MSLRSISRLLLISGSKVQILAHPPRISEDLARRSNGPGGWSFFLDLGANLGTIGRDGRPD